MCGGGGTCDSELCSLHTSVWCQGSCRVLESFPVAFSHLSRYRIHPFLLLSHCLEQSQARVECIEHSLNGKVSVLLGSQLYQQLQDGRLKQERL